MAGRRPYELTLTRMALSSIKHAPSFAPEIVQMPGPAMTTKQENGRGRRLCDERKHECGMLVYSCAEHTQ